MNKLTKAILTTVTLAVFVLAGSAENAFGKAKPHGKNGKKAAAAKRQDSGSMEWDGRVDDRVRVEVKRRNARTVTMSGQNYGEGQAYFSGRMPNNQRVSVRVEKLDGRGRVYVVEQPSRRNNFTAVVEIVDNKGGADRYRFRLYW